jgi:hypothetical protein
MSGPGPEERSMDTLKSNTVPKRSIRFVGPVWMIPDRFLTGGSGYRDHQPGVGRNI